MTHKIPTDLLRGGFGRRSDAALRIGRAWTGSGAVVAIPGSLSAPSRVAPRVAFTREMLKAGRLPRPAFRGSPLITDFAPTGDTPRIVGRQTLAGGLHLPVTQFVVAGAEPHERFLEGVVPDAQLTLDDVFDQEARLSELTAHLYTTLKQRFDALEALKGELRGAVPLPGIAA